MNLDSLRREYLQGGLCRDELARDPFDQFSLWMQQAIELGVVDPTAMTIATVAADGQPSQRIVLLKHFDDSGFVFYTNYGSRKADELATNPKISLHFPWHAIERQVKVCGEVVKVSTAESLKYFASRPMESQIAAIASQQSRVLTSRSFLLNQFESLKQKFSNGEIRFRTSGAAIGLSRRKSNSGRVARIAYMTAFAIFKRLTRVGPSIGSHPNHLGT